MSIETATVYLPIEDFQVWLDLEDLADEEGFIDKSLAMQGKVGPNKLLGFRNRGILNRETDGYRIVKDIVVEREGVNLLAMTRVLEEPEVGENGSEQVDATESEPKVEKAPPAHQKKEGRPALAFLAKEGKRTVQSRSHGSKQELPILANKAMTTEEMKDVVAPAPSPDYIRAGYDSGADQPNDLDILTRVVALTESQRSLLRELVDHTSWQAGTKGDTSPIRLTEVYGLGWKEEDIRDLLITGLGLPGINLIPNCLMYLCQTKGA